MTTNSSVEPAPASNGLLTVERLSCRINLPGSIEDAASIAGRIEHLARKDVAHACVEHLDWPDDQAVYRIRHLHLSLWLNKDTMSTGEISRKWGGLLARAIMRSVRSGASRNVVRFASPRAFVTAFLRDIVDGRGWEQWYYEEFHHLRRLPAGSIAAFLLADRPGWIAPVMHDLDSTGHASRLLARMTYAEIARLWSALGLPPQPGTGLLLDIGAREQQILSRLISLLPSVALSYGFDRQSRARDRFTLLLSASRGSIVDIRDPVAAAVIHAVVDLVALSRLAPDLLMTLMMRSELYSLAVQRIASGPLNDVPGWISPLSRTREGRMQLSRLAEAVSTIAKPQIFTNGASDPTAPTAPEPLHSKDQTPSDRVSGDEPSTRGRAGSTYGDTGMNQSITGDTPPTPGESREVHPRRSLAMSSSVGSVFLLTPALAETGLWEYWRAEYGEEMARRCIFLLALKALGSQRAPLFLDDGMLAAFAGLERPPQADARLPEVEGEVTVAWLGSIPGIASRWYPEPTRDLAEGTAHGLDVVRDFRSSFWLVAWPTNDRHAPEAQAALQSLVSSATSMPRRMSDSEQPVLALEATHLQLGRRIGFSWLTPSLDAALSTAASLVLRRTAARFPRLGESSPSYLANQFLAQPANLRFDHAFLTVELSGGPLGIVLRLAALPEWIQAPWLSRPVALRLSSEPGGN